MKIHWMATQIKETRTYKYRPVNTAGSCSSFPTCRDPNINSAKDTVPPQLPPLSAHIIATYTDGIPLPPTITASDNDPCFNTCASSLPIHKSNLRFFQCGSSIPFTETVISYETSYETQHWIWCTAHYLNCTAWEDSCSFTISSEGHWVVTLTRMLLILLACRSVTVTTELYQRPGSRRRSLLSMYDSTVYVRTFTSEADTSGATVTHTQVNSMLFIVRPACLFCRECEIWFCS